MIPDSLNITNSFISFILNVEVLIEICRLKLIFYSVYLNILLSVSRDWLVLFKRNIKGIFDEKLFKKIQYILIFEKPTGVTVKTEKNWTKFTDDLEMCLFLFR